MMFDSYFNNSQLIQFTVSFLLLFFSIFSFESKSNNKLYLALLILSVFLLKLWIANLDTFLHFWDEQYHALVAKNLSTNFLKPTLYPNPILSYDYTSWYSNYIWVHKQPFFLWLIALSIKILGPTVIAVRLPSVILLTFSVFCIYRIGSNVASKRVGFYGAIFFSLCNYINELASGFHATDHNDAVAISMITASIWTWSEHIINPASKKWLILTGVFVGCSVLTKWLIGFLIFPGWFLYLILANKSYKRILYTSINMFKSLAIALIIAIPWQIYIFAKYPLEAKHEYTFNAKHFGEALEGHGGDSFYYLNMFPINYGLFAPYLLVLGLFFLFKRSKSKPVATSLIFLFLFIYVFFTLAATKMPSFTLIIASVVFLSFGSIIEYFTDNYNKNNNKLLSVSFSLAISCFFFIYFNIESIQERHTSWKKNLFYYFERKNQLQWKQISDELNNTFHENNIVIFNCPPGFCPSLMYYTNFIGYSGLPDINKINTTLIKGYKVAIIDDGNLPESTYNLPFCKIISPKPFKILKIDSCYIKTDDGKFLSLLPDNSLSLGSEEKKQLFIIKFFADSCNQIKTIDGRIAKVEYQSGAGILFNSNQYSFLEKFRFVKRDKNSLYSITLEDNIPLKLNNENNTFYARKNKVKESLFEFISIKNTRY